MEKTHAPEHPLAGPKFFDPPPEWPHPRCEIQVFHGAAYDIAVTRETNGTYGLTADLWNGYVDDEVGTNYGKLLQLYGVHKAILEARKEGLSVIRRPEKNGAIKLILMGA